jgi:hypothetical protein
MNELERQVRQERSMPVQSRVDVVSLAKMDKYWMAEGYNIKSMSQLVSWSLDLVCQVIEANKSMPEGIDDIVEANRHLTQRGLYQPSMLKKGYLKRATAMSFKSTRDNNIDPKMYANSQYKTIHQGNEIEIFEGKVKSIDEEKMYYKDDIEDALRKVEEVKKEERDLETKKAIEEARTAGRLREEVGGKVDKITWDLLDSIVKKNGVEVDKPTFKDPGIMRKGMSQYELDEYTKARDAEIQAKENAPIDLEEMKRHQAEREAKAKAYAHSLSMNESVEPQDEVA